MNSYTVPAANRLGRKFLRVFLKAILRGLSEIKISGLENIPADPYIMVFNHVSLYETPVILTHWPKAPEVLGAADVWNKPGQNLLAKIYGGIPIIRGEIHREALLQIVNAVNSGYSLMLSPEGTRSHQPGMQQAKPGIVYLIEKTDAPILPIGITGTTSDFLKKALLLKRPVVTVTVGKPFKVPDLEETGLTRAEVRQQKADFVMRRIAELVPSEYRGYYS